MSKHRPSYRTHGAPSRPDLAPWRRRVFRNSYTRRGRTCRIRGWSFKIQYQGRRQTFSLQGRSRTEAAKAARRLHETLLAEGWEAAIRLHGRQRRGGLGPLEAEPASLFKHRLAQWEQRLIQRRYHEARLVSGPEYSARIEHDGAFAFFPLGSDRPKLAAQQALEIHQTILTRGWPTVLERFAHEITMAIFWSDNPVAVTYATLYTFAGAEPPASGPEPAVGDHSRKRVVVLEPDPVVLGCIRFWLDRQPGFRCPAGFLAGQELLDGLDWKRTALVLVNRACPELDPVLRSLQARRPEMPVFPYQIHEESDQIFISVSGVSGGYILKRRVPQALFDPLQPAAAGQPLSTSEASRRIRDYFQAFFDQSPPDRLPTSTETLTHREQEILNYISKGYLDKEIARHLNLSIWTVHNHAKRIYEKLKVHNRTEAVLRYLQK